MENVNDAEFFTSGEFNAPEYVADFLRSVHPGEEARRLNNLRQSLTARSNNAADQIKDIVFDHYKQFIDTSKEISKLEKEIYQLSTLLTDQRHLLEGLMEMSGLEKRSSCSASLTTNSGLSSQQTHQLQTLMNRMDDIAPILNSAGEQERILLQGQLLLLDPETFKPKHTVYAVLLSNNLLIGHPNPDSGTGHQKHPFHLATNYSLDSLALINVKRTPSKNFDDSSDLNIVQLLVFPEHLYLRCESARVKREWLESVEEAKRKQHEERALVRQATIRARRRSILNTIATRASTLDNVRNKKDNKLHEKIIEEEDDIEEDDKGKQIELGKRRRMSIEDSVWLNDLVNELQDVISHRHTEEAVEMLMEWKSCSCSDSALNAKFASIERQVVQILTDDLKRFSSVYGGPKALAQPLQQLIALGRSTCAIELYLKKRSVVLRAAARELIISEEPLSYVRQVSCLFINDIVEVCTELSIYPKQLCLTIAWSSRELGILLSLIRKNVIEVAPTMAVLTNTWRILVGKCSHLFHIGLDLSFEINRLAAPSLRTALQANFNNILESIKLRNSEEHWTPFSLDSDQNLIRFLEEMSDIGFQMEWAICRPESPSSPDFKYRFALNVSQSACMFARIALQLSRDLALLNSSPHLQQISNMFICKIWTQELSHLTSKMHPSIVHHCSSRFIISQVLPLCEQVLQCGDDSEGVLHEILHKKFSHLVHFQRRSSSEQTHEDHKALKICNGQFSELENTVLAEPRVDCGVESITVWIRMEKPFHGRLYVEDEVDQPECVHSYAKNWGSDSKGPSDSRGADFTIRFGQCNMRRQRLLNPRGVSYSFTLIVSFHPVFLTGIDRAFNIRCFFMEAVKAIETALDVSPLLTSVVEREFILPHCSYQLKQRGVDGPLMKYATIGEPITHLWQCDPVAGWLYGLLIHSCFVDDGHGKNRFDLINERGCVTDRSLLAEISYDEKAFTAYAHTHVFRYADRVQLFFTCTIQLCYREDGGCDGISPPQCNKGTIGSSLSDSLALPSFMPLDSHEELPPVFRRGHLHSKSSLSLKDSPILTVNSNDNGSSIAEQLLSASMSSNNHSRAGRNAAIEFVNNRMETDLSADLTVVPRTINGMAERSNNKDEHVAGMDPFIRVFPIRSREYFAATPHFYSLDSQRFGSFEVLAIAAASFVITITFVLLITMFGLQHCRLKRLLVHKLCSLENDEAIIIG